VERLIKEDGVLHDMAEQFGVVLGKNEFVTVERFQKMVAGMGSEVDVRAAVEEEKARREAEAPRE
jgi:hypothetical protein